MFKYTKTVFLCITVTEAERNACSARTRSIFKHIQTIKCSLGSSQLGIEVKCKEYPFNINN